MTEPRECVTLMGCSIGNCVHIAGVANFFRLAECCGFNTILLGAAVQPEFLAEQISKIEPDAVCVSYRLSPDNCRNVLKQLKSTLECLRYDGKLIFGGTPKTVSIAKEFSMFDCYFIGGESVDQVCAVFEWLRGNPLPSRIALVDRERGPIQLGVDNLPVLNDQGLHMPLFRHHFGLPSMSDTVAGVRKISDAQVLDVISIAPDQNAQQFFFRPSERDPRLDGAGGTPIRSKKDLIDLHHARQSGNRPYLRIYSGTQDLLRWAQLSVSTIDNAWGTIPLCWYSELDGRSRRPLADAIRENMSVIKWYAEVGKPIEINEAHHWALRDAPDTVSIAMAYLAAYVARKMRVKQYFAQYMFNTPSFTAMPNDLAKIAAKIFLVKSLENEDFHTYRQVRAGLAHFSVDTDIAKGQLGVATFMMMAFNPHILHIVSFSEGDHAALPEEVIESAKIVRGVIQNASLGIPNLFADPTITRKAEKLFLDAQILLGAVKLLGETMGSSDPLSDPEVIARAVRGGIFDAPHLRGQLYGQGAIRTLPMKGGCVAVDKTGRELSEYERLREPARRLKLNYKKIEKLEPFVGESIPVVEDGGLLLSQRECTSYCNRKL